MASNRVARVYLEGCDRETNSLGISIVQLILALDPKASQLSKQLEIRVEQEIESLQRDEVVEFIETVLVYKFPQLSREEIEAMFTASDLKHTRVYQDAKQEGMQQVAINLLIAGMTIEQVATLTSLSIEQVKQLQEK